MPCPLPAALTWLSRCFIIGQSKCSAGFVTSDQPRKKESPFSQEWIQTLCRRAQTQISIQTRIFSTEIRTKSQISSPPKSKVFHCSLLNSGFFFAQQTFGHVSFTGVCFPDWFPYICSWLRFPCLSWAVSSTLCPFLCSSLSQIVRVFVQKQHQRLWIFIHIWADPPIHLGTSSCIACGHLHSSTWGG